jgi:hypothetical protein
MMSGNRSKQHRCRIHTLLHRSVTSLGLAVRSLFPVPLPDDGWQAFDLKSNSMGDPILFGQRKLRCRQRSYTGKPGLAAALG